MALFAARVGSQIPAKPVDQPMSKLHVLVPLAVAMLTSTGLGQRGLSATSVSIELKPVSYQVSMGQAVPRVTT